MHGDAAGRRAPAGDHQRRAAAVTDSPPPSAVTLGFLSLTQDASGVSGGYLLTNAWGRPLEFRLSSAVQPTKVQQILYGPTLTDYLHGELIGKTLVEKSSARPVLIVTDTMAGLSLAKAVGVPVVAVGPGEGSFRHERSSQPLTASDPAVVLPLLELVDPVVDLAEPFARVREAAAEARKLGGASRAAA
jgi:hypothetical protein